MALRPLILCGAAAALLLAAGCTPQTAGGDLHPLLAPEPSVSLTEPHELSRMHETAKRSAPDAEPIPTF